MDNIVFAEPELYFTVMYDLDKDQLKEFIKFVQESDDTFFHAQYRIAALKTAIDAYAALVCKEALDKIHPPAAKKKAVKKEPKPKKKIDAPVVGEEKVE